MIVDNVDICVYISSARTTPPPVQRWQGVRDKGPSSYEYHEVKTHSCDGRISESNSDDEDGPLPYRSTDS